MAESNTRQASRSPVALKIKFKSETLDQFIERYSVDISHGGIFIRTKKPLAVGTSLRFEFQLKDATPLIVGDGTVVWTREHDPKRAGISPGMGVRFDKLPPDSQKTLERVLARKNGEPVPAETSSQFDDDDDDDDDGGFKEMATRVAPAALVDTLMNSSNADFEDRDPTPLPKPVPFHSDADDFSEEAFAESTRVASLDSILAQTKNDGPPDDSGVFASSSRPDKAEKTDKPPVESFADPFGDLSDVDEEGRTSQGEAEDESSAKAAVAAKEKETKAAKEKEAKAAKEKEAKAAREKAAKVDASKKNESTSQDTKVASKSMGADKKTATAQATPANDQDEGASSMRWVGVALVILLIGGAGGFWLLNNGEADESATKPPKDAPTLSAAPEVPRVPPVREDEIKDPVKDPVVKTTKLTLRVAPAGSTVSVVGTELSSEAPATFDLEEGKTYSLEVSQEGFVTKRIEVVAGAAVEPVTLVQLEKTIRISSEPAGAIVIVNGTRLPGRTPIDQPLSRFGKVATLRIQMRLAGHKPFVGTMATKNDYVSQEDKFVKTFTATLNRAPVVRPRPKRAVPLKKPATGDDTEPKKEGSDTEATETEATAPKKEEAPATTTEAAPDTAAPTPDWMK